MSLPSRQKHIDKFWSAEIDAQNFEVLVDKILGEMPPETTCHEMAVFECSSPPPSLAGGKVTCDCYNYSSMQTCAHSEAAGENLGCLEMFLHWRERCSTKIPNFIMVLSDALNRAGEKNGGSNAKRRGGEAENSCPWPHGRKVCRSFYSHCLWLGTFCAKQTVHRNSTERKPICPNIRSGRQGVQEEKKGGRWEGASNAVRNVLQWIPVTVPFGLTSLRTMALPRSGQLAWAMENVP